jgi:hypothetical protein
VIKLYFWQYAIQQSDPLSEQTIATKRERERERERERAKTSQFLPIITFGKIPWMNDLKVPLQF